MEVASSGGLKLPTREVFRENRIGSLLRLFLKAFYLDGNLALMTVTLRLSSWHSPPDQELKVELGAALLGIGSCPRPKDISVQRLTGD